MRGSPPFRMRSNRHGESNMDSSSGSGSGSMGSPSSGRAAGSNAVRRHHGSTLSSIHQFQQQLDKKISSLQERLSTYRLRISNAGEAAAAVGACSSTSNDEV
mmetsp:Transcript_10814/g.26721  ORF Transcript_10814/g.26721 Transcript_10814/m.26721 type:complete len:102 (-) Transcript_10814:111-416(-)